MNSELKTYLTTPLIGAIFELDDYICNVRTLAPKWMRNTIIDPVIMHQCGILYQQAIRELRGMDYLKRAHETLLEIQAASYRVYHHRGWSLKVASRIDMLCDIIVNALYTRRSIGAAKTIKSKDECGSA